MGYYAFNTEISFNKLDIKCSSGTTGGNTQLIIDIPSRKMVGPGSFSFPLLWLETLVLNGYVHSCQDMLSSTILSRDQT